MKKNISYNNSSINYYEVGNGTEILFCFHGYGETAASFLFLENELYEKYTIIAIDFPLHGETVWNHETFTPKDLMNIIELIMPLSRKFSILAYSMGGRLALHLLQTFSQKINSITLVAPDGLHVNFWYWLGTQTSFGKLIFRTTMKNPSWIFGIMRIADKTNLLNKSLLNFLRRFLESKYERQLLYKRWIMMKEFKPTHSGLKRIIKKWPGNLNLIFGKYDPMILKKRSDFLIGYTNVSIEIIDAGHNLLKEKYSSEITAALL